MNGKFYILIVLQCQKIKENVLSYEMTSIKSKQMSISCFLGMNYVLLQHDEIVIHVASSQKLLRFANCSICFRFFETFSYNCFSFLQLVMDYTSVLFLTVMDTSVVCSLRCKKVALIAKRCKPQKSPMV